MVLYFCEECCWYFDENCIETIDFTYNMVILIVLIFPISELKNVVPFLLSFIMSLISVL